MQPTREKFLKECWTPYPPFPSEDGWVGGRLSQTSDGEFVLESASLKIPLHFVTTVLDQIHSPCEFSPALLRSGDMVAIRLSGPSVSKVRLLVAASDAKPSRLEFTPRRAREWAEFIDSVRSFFKHRAFTEVLTPTLVPSPGTEPYLDAFTTDWRMGSSRKTMFLPTSPEFHLKKMLASGFERIFEVKTCFRNGEVGEHHQPEFQMLEWYRVYATLDQIADDVKELLKPHHVREVSVAQLFKEYLHFTLTPETTRDELEDLCLQKGILTTVDDAWDDLFFRLFLERIEHQIDPAIPTIVRYYPPSQAALSRILPNGWADRFEVYWKGLEIANAFHELNNPDENIARFEQDNAAKIRTGRAPVPIDNDLIRALKAGMPPAGGIALGLDRLFMALNSETKIERTRAFPFKAD